MPPKGPRRDFQNRGLEVITRSDGSKYWRVRIQHDGKGNRFGPFKSEETARAFYAKIKDQCRGQLFFPEEFKRVKNSTTKRLPRNVKEIREAWENKDIAKSGVYFIQPASGGLIKIGYSDNIPGRFRQIQYQCPVPLKLLGVIPGNPTMESSIHRAVINERHHGEWFLPKGKVLGLMQRYKITPADSTLHFTKDWNPKILIRLQEHFSNQQSLKKNWQLPRNLKEE